MLKYFLRDSFLFLFFEYVFFLVGKWIGNVFVLMFFFGRIDIGVLFFVGEILNIWLKYKFKIFCLMLDGCK